MILVIGGLASGKRAYVKAYYGYTEDEMSDAVLNDSPVLYNLQDLVKTNPKNSMTFLPELLKKEVVICNEIGSGLVPIDSADRQAREMTGSLCIALAEQAEKVIRVFCGIACVIKE